MAEDEAVVAGRRFAVFGGENFPIGAADAERQRAHQDRSVCRRRLGHVLEPGEFLTPGGSVMERMGV